MKPNSKVLEIGCSTGFVTKEIKKKNCFVTGGEIDYDSAEKAKMIADQVIIGNIEDNSIWNNISDKYDYVIMGDVLEHLIDPENVLLKLKNVLSENGELLLSVPNVAYYKIRLDLLFGRFNYTEFGILDSSHLKFFTKETLYKMLHNTGYEIKELEYTYHRFRDRLLKWFPDTFIAYQFVVRAIWSKK
ncbi:MAG: class I SAM-dependent methyltransferase [Armatimonadota bacterium]